MSIREHVCAVNRQVDAVYVLSVRSFDDRIAHMRTQLQRLGVAFEFVFEFDPNAIPAGLIARRFAPSDMTLAHQSLVLKHIETWRRCVERNHRRVLVLEDDAILADGFGQGLAAALDEAQQLPRGWLVYLGRGDNRHLGGGTGASALVPAGPLPATDSLVFDRAAASRRLTWLRSHRLARPADWLLREVDASVGVRHRWLREPLVEQGSMSGLFVSTLDGKRRARGRWYNWTRYRWDRWWKHARAHWRQRSESLP